MMRALDLLALLGAAPAADITPAATCTLPRAETEAAFRALPLLSTEDDTEADERGTIYTFRDAMLWGAPARRIKLSDYADSKAGTATQTYETVAAGDYTATRAQLLAAHGKAKCDREFEHGCDINFANEGKWQKALTIGQTGDGLIVLTCIFSIPPG